MSLVRLFHGATVTLNTVRSIRPRTAFLTPKPLAMGRKGIICQVAAVLILQSRASWFAGS
jgi:hypothetical protein